MSVSGRGEAKGRQVSSASPLELGQDFLSHSLQILTGRHSFGNIKNGLELVVWRRGYREKKAKAATTMAL